mmetsp:Transcript_30588/g.72344  ORF Transcript_30588/g.72344 Transcript_30588/m.72344 type:complete len:311 (+) Transcript_30588:118-1050(+)
MKGPMRGVVRRRRQSRGRKVKQQTEHDDAQKCRTFPAVETLAPRYPHTYVGAPPTLTGPARPVAQGSSPPTATREAGAVHVTPTPEAGHIPQPGRRRARSRATREDSEEGLPRQKPARWTLSAASDGVLQIWRTTAQSRAGIPKPAKTQAVHRMKHAVETQAWQRGPARGFHDASSDAVTQVVHGGALPRNSQRQDSAPPAPKSPAATQLHKADRRKEKIETQTALALRPNDRAPRAHVPTRGRSPSGGAVRGAPDHDTQRQRAGHTRWQYATRGLAIRSQDIKQRSSHHRLQPPPRQGDLAEENGEMES